jgi:uncharacterized protein YfaS (alpha-2-macroglobulin family)
MLKLCLKLSLLCVLLSGAALYSQNDDNSTGKVKAVVSDLPGSMNVGETYKVTVTITNTGKNKWSSADLTAKAYGPFYISKEWSGEWTIEPGQSTQTFYAITAPQKSGKYKLKVVFYNHGKRIGTKSKKIEVVSTTMK